MKDLEVQQQDDEGGEIMCGPLYDFTLKNYPERFKTDETQYTIEKIVGEVYENNKLVYYKVKYENYE